MIRLNPIAILKMENSVGPQAFSADGDFLLTGNWAGMISILRPSDLTLYLQFKSGCRPLYSAAMNPRNHDVITVGQGASTLWNCYGEKLDYLSDFATSTASCAQFSPDGRRLLIGSSSEKIVVIDLPSRRIEFKLLNTGERNMGIEFHPDGATMAITSCWQAGSRVAFRKLDDPGREIKRRSLYLFYDELQPAVFSPCGEWLAVTHRYVELYAYPSLTKSALIGFGTEPGHPVVGRDELWSNVQFIKGKPLIVAGSPDGNIVFWNTETGYMTHAIPAHRGRIIKIAVSPDSKSLVSSGADYCLKLWSIDDVPECHPVG